MACAKAKLKIAIIDEGVNKTVLKNILPSCEIDFKLVLCKDSCNFIQSKNGGMSHGTLCTALLIESLYLHKIMHSVELIVLPITNEKGEKHVNGLVNALEYCKNNSVNIISLSMGIKCLAYISQMLEIIKKLKNCIIVAAAANDFKLTYPAALSSVIGVKRSISKQDRLMVIENSLDGIDIIAPNFTSSVLQNVLVRYKLDYHNTNSILVPEIATRIAKNIIENKVSCYEKEYILRILKNTKITNYYEQIFYDYEYDMNIIQPVPIILIEYTDSNYLKSKKFAQLLQKMFLSSEYSCSVLNDKIKKSYYESAWYKINVEKLIENINNYLAILPEGAIILLLESGIINKDEVDIVIKTERFANIDMLDIAKNEFNKILELFGSE